jgi:hypothetical protein
MVVHSEPMGPADAMSGALALWIGLSDPMMIAPIACGRASQALCAAKQSRGIKAGIETGHVLKTVIKQYHLRLQPGEPIKSMTYSKI